MDTDKTDNPVKEVLDGLFTQLETLETQNFAVLEFLKEQGIATDEKLAPYLDRAASASSVKWRAARARMTYLLAPAPKKATDQTGQPGQNQPQVKDPEPNEAASENTGSEGAATKGAASSDPEPKDAERKPSETKEPGAKGPEMKSADQKKADRTTEKANSGDPGSGSVSDRDPATTDNTGSRQYAAGSKMDAKSKAATVAQGDQSAPARTPNAQDTPAKSKK